MTFGNWDESLHREPEQVLKRKRAASVILENVDPDTKTANAIGSGEESYKVSLESCTCGSFNTGKPCKHIYRLAYEFGLIEDLPSSDRAASKAFKESIPSEIKRFEELYFNGAITAEKYAAIVKALKSK